MRCSSWLLLIASVGLTAGLAGCGGSTSTVSGTPPGNTSVSYNFTGGTPTAAAVQVGAGSFAAATLQSGALSVTIPDGTTNYSVAYVCPPIPGFGNTVTSEFVIQASTADGTSFNVSCQGSTATTGALTGSVDATAIPGAANVQIRGNLGYGTAVGASNGLFNVSLPTGTNDVALIVMDGSPQPNVLAVKILRSQTVPGAVNNGTVVTFQASDLTTSQPLSVTNVPAGFVMPPSGANIFGWPTSSAERRRNSHSLLQTTALSHLFRMRGPTSNRRSSVVKSVAKFHEDFARIVPVEAAEGDAVVEFHAAVGHVHGIHRRRESFAEILA